VSKIPVGINQATRLSAEPVLNPPTVLESLENGFGIVSYDGGSFRKTFQEVPPLALPGPNGTDFKENRTSTMTRYVTTTKLIEML
jgi:hypothetical protein